MKLLLQRDYRLRGYHDWLRGVKGSEERALNAIRLLCDRGYYVHVHQSVWKDSLSSIIPTVQKLEELGVSRYRLVPVEPSPRWMQLAPDQSVSTRDWLSFVPGFLDWWYEHRIDMDLDIWSFWSHKCKSKHLIIVPDLVSRGESGSSPACYSNRNRPFIGADGRLVPCMPFSGITDAHGVFWGNVYKRDDLSRIFTDFSFLGQISCTHDMIKEADPENAGSAPLKNAVPAAAVQRRWPGDVV